MLEPVTENNGTRKLAYLWVGHPKRQIRPADLELNSGSLDIYAIEWVVGQALVDRLRLRHLPRVRVGELDVRGLGDPLVKAQDLRRTRFVADLRLTQVGERTRQLLASRNADRAVQEGLGEALRQRRVRGGVGRSHAHGLHTHEGRGVVQGRAEEKQGHVGTVRSVHVRDIILF